MVDELVQVPPGARGTALSATLRAGRAGDVDAVATLNRARNGTWTEGWVRALFTDPGPSRWRIAEIDGEVAAAAVLLPARWSLEDVAVPTAQVEFVATAERHEGRGLARAVLAALHAQAAAEGALATYLTGIPWFYRPLGYEYALTEPARRRLDESALDALTGTQEGGLPDGWRVRSASTDDLAILDDLHAAEAARAGAGLVGHRQPDAWRWALAAPSAAVLLAEGPGGARATARVTDDDPRFRVALELGATSPAALLPLLTHLGATDRPVLLADRPGTAAGAALAGITQPHEADAPHVLSVRVADPLALLNRLAPVLSARLARSPYAGWSGRVTLTAYRWAAELEVRAGEVVGVTRRPPLADPTGGDRIGVPPDLVATLLFGNRCASALAAGQPDVVLGSQRHLADALFPGVTADLHAY